MKLKILILAITTTSLFTSCVVEPPEAKKLTFVNAMGSLSDGMRILREGSPKAGEKQLGLVPTEMTATFMLTTTASNELGVNLAAAPTELFSSATFNGKNAQGINRTNSVTVVFKNVYVDKDGKLRPAGETKVPDVLDISGTPLQ